MQCRRLDSLYRRRPAPDNLWGREMTRRSLYGAPAVRVQVLLTEQQAAQIAGLARGRGTTSAQWLRETVIAELHKQINGGHNATDTNG